jgi:uridine kinase
MRKKGENNSVTTVTQSEQRNFRQYSEFDIELLRSSLKQLAWKSEYHMPKAIADNITKWRSKSPKTENAKQENQATPPRTYSGHKYANSTVKWANT